MFIKNSQIILSNTVFGLIFNSGGVFDLILCVCGVCVWGGVGVCVCMSQNSIAQYNGVA